MNQISPFRSIAASSSLLASKCGALLTCFEFDSLRLRCFPVATTSGGTTATGARGKCEVGQHVDWGCAGYQEPHCLYRLYWCSDQSEVIVISRSTILSRDYQVMSYIAVVFRHPHEQFRQYAELIPGITVRLLQDCPAEASSTRKVCCIVFD